MWGGDSGDSPSRLKPGLCGGELILSVTRTPGTLADGFNGSDVQQGNKCGAFGDAFFTTDADVEAVLHAENHLGVEHGITITTAGDDLARLEGVTSEKFLNGIVRHHFAHPGQGRGYVEGVRLP